MRNYQRTRNNPYYLPHNVYMQALYMVRDYGRLCETRQEIITAVPAPGPRVESGPGDPTARKAALIESISERIYAIEGALSSIPAEYRTNIMNHIQGGGVDLTAISEATWRRWRARLLYYVAQRMRWI